MKNYIEPEMNLVRFEAEDVLTASVVDPTEESKGADDTEIL